LVVSERNYKINNENFVCFCVFVGDGIIIVRVSVLLSVCLFSTSNFKHKP
jgi:hypothetical protein